MTLLEHKLELALRVCRRSLVQYLEEHFPHSPVSAHAEIVMVDEALAEFDHQQARENCCVHY